jgi:hypothetical protein
MRSKSMKIRDRLPIYYIAAASLYAIAGMGMGLYMHLTHYKRPVPFHGHLDSLGWLSLAVVGIVLHIFPWAKEHKLATIQFGLLQAGTALMLFGLPLAILDVTRIPIEVGVFLVPAGYLVFSFIIFSGLRRQ